MDRHSKRSTDNYFHEQSELIENKAIYFDDQSLEYILYGEGNSCSTMANRYLFGAVIVNEFIVACQRYDWWTANNTAEQLCQMEEHLSKEHYCRILKMIDSILPSCPRPKPFHFDVGCIMAVISHVWEYAISCDDKNLQNDAGPLLIRLYEYQENYEKALIVAKQLLNNHIQSKNGHKQASILNNYGFILLSQQRWVEALPLFEQAATLYRDLGVGFNHANSLCNYWHCRFMIGDWGVIEETNSILETLTEKLKDSKSWYERKPLVLHAQLEAHLGNHLKAMQLVAKAIRTSRLSGTTYQDDDRKYLKKLSEEYRKSRKKARKATIPNPWSLKSIDLKPERFINVFDQLLGKGISRIINK